MLSRLVAALDGRYTAQTAKVVHDTQNHTSQRLALEADESLGVQAERLRESVTQLKVGLYISAQSCAKERYSYISSLTLLVLMGED